jgi:hypothetical protein
VSVPSRGRLAHAPALAAVLGGLALLIVLAAIPLEVVNPGTFSVRGSDALSDATGVVFVLAFGAMGTLVARRQPANPIGWGLLAATIAWELGNYIPSYLIVDYRVHHGSLPLGHVAMVLDSSFLYSLLLVPLVILVFPDGRLGRRWRWPLYAYVAVCLADVAATVSVAVSDFGLRMPIDSGDSLVNSNHPRGAEAWSGSVQALGLLALFALSIAAVVHQIRSYRRASGERRAQLRWLGSAAALCVLLLPTFVWSNAPGAIGDALALGLTAVPVAIAMGFCATASTRSTGPSAARWPTPS